jgi:hypothetical protein
MVLTVRMVLASRMFARYTRVKSNTEPFGQTSRHVGMGPGSGESIWVMEAVLRLSCEGTTGAPRWHASGGDLIDADQKK